MDKQILLDIQHLNVSFWTEKDYLHALHDVSFQIKKGEIVGVVGESGCGKSVTADAILKLHEPQLTDYSGEIRFNNENLLVLSEKKLRKIRGNEISMIFQNPMSSLNPVFTVGQQITEALQIHKKLSRKKARSKVIELLSLVGIPSPEIRIDEYPHQLSGGMRQRVMIAMAICCEPKLLIADEPSTALDVTIQSQILQIIKDLTQKNEMSVMLITHDLGIVAETCNRVIVMYLGQVIESGTVQEIFDAPLHPYTKGLIRSMPQPTSNPNERLFEIKGTVPPLSEIPKGCRFANRCEFATEVCIQSTPELNLLKDDRSIRCWHHDEISRKEVLYAGN
jgi:peptide/nickel transport system ATP-binding protein